MIGKSESKKCLVLGANGFIGSYMVDYLCEMGFDVIAYDRFSRLPQYRPSDRVTQKVGDINDLALISSLLSEVYFVFHCFSDTNPFISDKNPYVDVEKNLLTNIRIFEACGKGNVKKIIYISSGGAIYGKIAEEKYVTEQDAPLPISPYGICKLASENYLSYFKQHYDMDYVIYRLTNPYGPRQITKNNQGVIPTFINKIRDSKEITVLGDGSASRDYILVDDAVKMITSSFKDAKQTIYNIGSGKQTSLTEIITAISRKLNLEPRIVYNQIPKTFLSSTKVSIDSYENEFGKPDLRSIEDGIQYTIESV